jgi:hypothetical protein
MPRDPLFRLLTVNGLAGLALGLGVTGAILWLDTGHLRTLLAADRDALAPALLLAGGFVVTCASVMMGSAIMLVPKGEGYGRGGGTGVPALARAHARTRRAPRA